MAKLNPITLYVMGRWWLPIKVILAFLQFS